MWKIDLKKEMNVPDSSGRVFKKEKELHGIRPERNIKNWSRSFQKALIIPKEWIVSPSLLLFSLSKFFKFSDSQWSMLS